ncbi:MAG: PQQ-binding-like beta-propeller repeat protein, partial [Anaerolineae bacterium]|jgi:outer membrane protein assembly factor BamB
LVWEFEGENWFWGSPATDGTTIYVADVDGNVYAVDAETGEEEWRQQVGETVRIGPVLARDEDLLLVAGNIGTLYGLDASSGDVVWSEGGEGYLASLGTADETFYVSRIYADQHIQAFRVAGDDITLEWGYPPPEAEE